MAVDERNRWTARRLEKVKGRSPRGSHIHSSQKVITGKSLESFHEQLQAILQSAMKSLILSKDDFIELARPYSVPLDVLVSYFSEKPEKAEGLMERLYNLDTLYSWFNRNWPECDFGLDIDQTSGKIIIFCFRK